MKVIYMWFDDDEEFVVKKVKVEDDLWCDILYVYIVVCVFSWYFSFNFYIILIFFYSIFFI